ncbi:MAG: restriction endonuclease subunit S [Planctomycetaceae bacterium]
MNETLEAMARRLFRSWFVDFDPVRAKAALRREHPRLSNADVSRRALPKMSPEIAELFPDAFEVSSLGLVPKEWKATTWGELATLEYGKSLSDYRTGNGQFQVYGTNGPIGWHTEPLWNGPGIIIGRKGAYRGVHYSPKPFFVIDTAFYLKPKTEFDINWAYRELLSVDINGMDSGSAIPSTSREDFYSLPIKFPPSAVLGAFGRAIAEGNEASMQYRQQSDRLAVIRDMLLPKLLSGQLTLNAC